MECKKKRFINRQLFELETYMRDSAHISSKPDTGHGRLKKNSRVDFMIRCPLDESMSEFWTVRSIELMNHPLSVLISLQPNLQYHSKITRNDALPTTLIHTTIGLFQRTRINYARFHVSITKDQ